MNPPCKPKRRRRPPCQRKTRRGAPRLAQLSGFEGSAAVRRRCGRLCTDLATFPSRSPSPARPTAVRKGRRARASGGGRGGGHAGTIRPSGHLLPSTPTPYPPLRARRRHPRECCEGGRYRGRRGRPVVGAVRSALPPRMGRPALQHRRHRFQPSVPRRPPPRRQWLCPYHHPRTPVGSGEEYRATE